jgi:hypothetical protein
VTEKPEDLEDGDLELLVRVVGWKRRIEPGELAAAARLVSAGFLIVEYRGGEQWVEATDQGVECRGDAKDPTRMRITMSGFFGTGSRRRRND